MAQIDLPLEELKKYLGTNPRPADFESFWKTGLAELGAVDPQIKIVPDDTVRAPYAESSDLYFTGPGGARIHAKLLRGKGEQTTRPAVLHFHGYSSRSGDWFGLLPYAAPGYTVAAMDCRGQGGLSEDVASGPGPTVRGHLIRGLNEAPDKLYYRNVYLDAALLAKIVMEMPEVDEERVAVTGGSQGGGLSIACAALEPRIRKAAVIYPFLCDFRRTWDLDLGTLASEDMKYYFRMYDPNHEREEDVFTKLGYIDNQHLAGWVEAEVLMAITLRDESCPPSTQFAAYNKMRSPKRLLLYPDYGHEDIGGINDVVYSFLAEWAG